MHFQMLLTWMCSHHLQQNRSQNNEYTSHIVVPENGFSQVEVCEDGVANDTETTNQGHRCYLQFIQCLIVGDTVEETTNEAKSKKSRNECRREVTDL